MSRVVKLSDLSEFICCPICHGYLIDATTVGECLHTFCRTCIVKHIKENHNDCPKCNTLIHERRPMDYITHDRTKQDIVYKLVPQLYISEMERKMAVPDGLTSFIQVALVQKETTATSIMTTATVSSSSSDTIYLSCPITVRARHIRKLLAIKYQLKANNRLVLLYKGDIVDDEDHISNLAPSLTFCLHYQISRICATMNQDSVTTSTTSTLSNSSSNSTSISKSNSIDDSNGSDSMSIDS